MVSSENRNNGLNLIANPEGCRRKKDGWMDGTPMWAVTTNGEDEGKQLTKLKNQRSEVRERIIVVRNEISRGMKMVGSRASLTALVLQAEVLLRKSCKLTDRICSFQDRVNTAYEFETQLHYQTLVEDIKEEVLMYFCVLL